MKLLKRISSFACAAIISILTAQADGLLFDFGADATPTVGGVGGPATTWNNVNSIGMDDLGFLEGLLATDGTPSSLSLQMIARFNGPNEAGTTSSSLYPPSATRDSLYGNTEIWQGLENLFPAFKIVGLTPSATYTFTFFASRTGAADNRETRYTVTGTAETIAHLDAANNVTNTVTVSNVVPDASSEITIALSPGDNNNNPNHFTYINVLQIVASSGERYLIDFGAGNSPTDVVEAPATAFWNNLTPTVGATDTGVLDTIVTTNGSPTTITLQMVARFNGQNSNGTTSSTNFPATATQDSLFGNTEAFSGVSNILPIFKLTGLDTNFVFSFTFYGSRTGVSDNRETRYAVTGANSGEALLNTANNTNNTVSVADIRPNTTGEITIALTPGPNNINANHFTYLGVMKVDFVPFRTPRILIDFGGPNTTDAADDPNNFWNNVTTAIGSSDTGSLTNLVRTDNSVSSINLQMISRFNGANENGTQAGTLGGAPYVIEATRDSLFGNTELFSGLENITPIFNLTGLNPATSYDLTFYASRNGVGDNRETRYTVTGATVSTADLNIANNEFETVSVDNVLPNSSGEINIALTPGPNNDNANHFTYLGVLQIDWTGSQSAVGPTISNPRFQDGFFTMAVTGTPGITYGLQRKETLDDSNWEDVRTVIMTSETVDDIQVPGNFASSFYRLIQR